MSVEEQQPSAARFVLGFLLVGIAWGFTTPFMRRAAVKHDQATASRTSAHFRHTSDDSWIRQKVGSLYTTIADLLSRPEYSIPLLLNLTGSVWFFLLVGQAELSLTVPITNSLAFLFTVLGEWWAEGKTITRGSFMNRFVSSTR